MPTMKEIIEAIELDLTSEKLALSQSLERVRVANIRIKKAEKLLKKLKPLVEEVPPDQIKVQIVEDDKIPCPDCGQVFMNLHGVHMHQTLKHGA